MALTRNIEEQEFSRLQKEGPEGANICREIASLQIRKFRDSKSPAKNVRLVADAATKRNDEVSKHE
jgi:hypothetical protein